MRSCRCPIPFEDSCSKRLPLPKSRKWRLQRECLLCSSRDGERSGNIKCPSKRFFESCLTRNNSCRIIDIQPEIEWENQKAESPSPRATFTCETFCAAATYS